MNSWGICCAAAPVGCLQPAALCYVMHPAKLFEGLDETAAPLHGINLAAYAADLYERFWGEDANARSRISAHASFFREWI